MLFLFVPTNSKEAVAHKFWKFKERYGRGKITTPLIVACFRSAAIAADLSKEFNQVNSCNVILDNL